MRLQQARARLTRYLTKHGGRATIERKIGEAWSPVAEGVPVMVQLPAASATGVDPYTATSDQGQIPRLSFPHDTDVQSGDRIRVTDPGQGAVAPVLIVAGEAHSTLNASRDVTAVVEETGVETWPVAIERYEEASGAYVPVWSGEAAAVTTTVGQQDYRQSGAAGTARLGTLIIEPAPAVPVGVGDWITGIPWAKGARVTLVRPVVANRLELGFSYTGA